MICRGTKSGATDVPCKFKAKCGLQGHYCEICEITKLINAYKIDKFMNVSIDELKNNILDIDDAFNGFI